MTRARVGCPERGVNTSSCVSSHFRLHDRGGEGLCLGLIVREQSQGLEPESQLQLVQPRPAGHLRQRRRTPGPRDGPGWRSRRGCGTGRPAHRSPTRSRSKRGASERRLGRSEGPEAVSGHSGARGPPWVSSRSDGRSRRPAHAPDDPVPEGPTGMIGGAPGCGPGATQDSLQVLLANPDSVAHPDRRQLAPGHDPVHRPGACRTVAPLCRTAIAYDL